MAALGGHRLVEVGLCDDQSKPENIFKTWMGKVQTNLGFSKADIPEQEPLVSLIPKGTTLKSGFSSSERMNGPI